MNIIMIAPPHEMEIIISHYLNARSNEAWPASSAATEVIVLPPWKDAHWRTERELTLDYSPSILQRDAKRTRVDSAWSWWWEWWWPRWWEPWDSPVSVLWQPRHSESAWWPCCCLRSWVWRNWLRADTEVDTQSIIDAAGIWPEQMRSQRSCSTTFSRTARGWTWTNNCCLMKANMDGIIQLPHQYLLLYIFIYCLLNEPKLGWDMKNKSAF